MPNVVSFNQISGANTSLPSTRALPSHISRENFQSTSSSFSLASVNVKLTTLGIQIDPWYVTTPYFRVYHEIQVENI
jgi:hypothetical protein